MASRKHYTDEFKREAVRLATTPGNSMAGVARDLGVNRTLIGHWVKNDEAGKYEMKPGAPLKSEAQSESRRDSRRLVGVSQTIISDSASWR